MKKAPELPMLSVEIIAIKKAGKGTRTLDLLITNQLRYQLRYSGRTSTMNIILIFDRFGKSFLKKVSS